MRAYKCDRCKGYFDSKNDENDESREYTLYKWNDVRDADLPMDLCPDCYKKLVEFAKNADALKENNNSLEKGE